LPDPLPEPPLEPDPFEPDPFEPDPLESDPLESDPFEPDPFEPDPPLVPLLPLFPLLPFSSPSSSKSTVTGTGASTTSGSPWVGVLVGSGLGEADGVTGLLEVGVMATAGTPKGCPASLAKLSPLVRSTARVTQVTPTMPRTTQLASPLEVAGVALAGSKPPAGTLARPEPAEGSTSRCGMVSPVDSVTLNCPLRQAWRG